MKIAFVSDTHFGYERFREDALKQGKEAILDASKKADIIILGGDIVDKKNPDLQTIIEVVEILKEAKENLPEKFGKKIIAIAGTHELMPKNYLNPIGFLEKLELVKIVHNKTVIIEDEQRNQKVAIAGVNGVPDELVKNVFEKLECKPIDGAYNIFVFHQTLKEFINGKQASDEQLAEIDDLPEGYDLYLCGHIHNRREYKNGKLQLSGSTVITQLKEEEQNPKGYLIIDTITKKVEFIPIKTTKFIFKKLQLDNATNLEIKKRIQQEIEDIKNKNKDEKIILKIQLNGKIQKDNFFIQTEVPKIDNMIIEIENNIEGLNILEQMSMIKNTKYEQEPPEKIGMRFLVENAKKYNIEQEEVEKLFKKFLQEE
jgi:DNA repair exonuclease SbcCD nuclease subunit